jgi:hypothetical protein
MNRNHHRNNEINDYPLSLTINAKRFTCTDNPLLLLNSRGLQAVDTKNQSYPGASAPDILILFVFQLRGNPRVGVCLPSFSPT